MNVRQLIKLSMLRIGVISRQEEPQPDEFELVFIYLKMMLSSWSIEDFLLNEVKREQFDLAQKSDYTIGLGGDFNTTYPNYIHSVRVVDKHDGYHHNVPTVARNVWENLRYRMFESPYPDFCYFDSTFPLATLHFSHTTSEGYAVEITSSKELKEIENLNEEVNFPSGYDLGLMLSLACFIAPNFGIPIDRDLRNQRRSVLANLNTTNLMNHRFEQQMPAGLEEALGSSSSSTYGIDDIKKGLGS